MGSKKADRLADKCRTGKSENILFQQNLRLNL